MTMNHQSMYDLESGAPPVPVDDLLDTFRRFARDEDRLRPIDLLVKHRELFGFGALDCVDALIAASLSAGPQQSHLARPLVDDGAGFVTLLRRTAALREFVRDELGFTLDTAALTSAQFVSVAVPRLMTTMEAVRWARTADSRHLRIRLHSLQLSQQVAANGVVTPTIFPSAFRLRADIAWKNALLRDVSESHCTGPELFAAPDLYGVASSNPMGRSRGGGSGSFGELDDNCLTSSVSNMSLSTGAPSSSATVDVTTVFRTTCSTSCTIRVAVDTANGMEFAHGFIRASFLLGDAAPCASFSVPLVRPSNLSAVIAASKAASTKNKIAVAAAMDHAAKHARLNSSGSHHARSDSHASNGSSSTAAQQQGGSAHNLAAAAAAAAMAGGASRHDRAPPAAAHGTTSILVGSLSVDIDCISSHFANLLAVAQMQRRLEARESAGAAGAVGDGGGGSGADAHAHAHAHAHGARGSGSGVLPAAPWSGAVAPAATTSGNNNEQSSTDASAGESSTGRRSGESSTVAYFLQRLKQQSESVGNNGAAQRRKTAATNPVMPARKAGHDGGAGAGDDDHDDVSTNDLTGRELDAGDDDTVTDVDRALEFAGDPYEEEAEYGHRNNSSSRHRLQDDDLHDDDRLGVPPAAAGVGSSSPLPQGGAGGGKHDGLQQQQQQAQAYATPPPPHATPSAAIGSSVKPHSNARKYIAYGEDD